ncbi:MAG TPA: excisionase family DNA-binding protein [Thermohalobaculum sp.]|nr:excisionase family DNA-binding protein [Thermohalobaculum sp.]
MTIPASAEPFGGRLPSEREQESANQLRRILAARMATDADTRLKIAEDGGKTSDIVLSPALSALLLDLLRHVGRGDAVTLVPVGQMLTTQQAADILNVSRPYLIGLLEKGEIGFTLVGRHRRIRAEDLFAYKRKRDETRARALEELAEIDAELI